MTMMNSSKFALLTAALFCVSLAPVSLAYTATSGNTVQSNHMAYQGDTKKGMHKDWKAKHDAFAKKLNLTADQQQRLKAQRESFKASNKTAFDNMKQQHQTLRGYVKAGKGNSPEAIALKNQLEQQHETMRQQHQAMMQSVLTPAQLSQYNQMKTEWKNNHKNGKGCKHNPTKQS